MLSEKLVLVADDSRTSRLFICTFLENAGYKTIQAENGIEALNRYNEQKPCCIVLDLLMPEMDGFEVLKKLKEMKSETPVIVLSADVQEVVKNECFGYGAEAFLSKPFKKEELIETVERVTNT
ncbi:MAG: response regulator [Bacteroidales bacterium]|nr:MAG: response regulator [Bacteroidales bacterium]